MSRTEATQDPRDAIRGDLVAAARRRTARRRRRRAATLAAIATGGLLATTAGALAIGGHTTGVPLIDRVLEQGAKRIERHAAQSRRMHERGELPRWAVPAAPELRPGPGGATEPLDIAWLGDESRPWRALAYANRDGDICFALADTDQRMDDGTRAGHGCMPRARLADRLDERAAFAVCANPTSARRGAPIVVVACGYARAAVEGVRVSGPPGTADAALTEPWTPDDSDMDPLRLFVAFVATDTPFELPRQPRAGPPAVLSRLRLTATLGDGRVVAEEPLIDRGSGDRP